MPRTMKSDIIWRYLKRASFLYLIAAILSSVIVLGGLAVYLIFIPQDLSEPENQATDKEKDIIKSLTAPGGEIEPISKEMQESLTAPKSGNKVPDDILDSLSAPQK